MKKFMFLNTASIVRMLLMISPVFFTQFSQMEAATLRARPCTLAWNQSQEELVCGYAVYYGITGSTTNRLNVGMTNTVTFKNLSASSNYFFYVVAFNLCGVESSPSGAIGYTPRVFSPLSLTQLTNGVVNLRFEVATGAVCHVEYTPTLNPAQWQTLSSATGDANGNVVITDPLSENTASRFYRTALP